MSRTWESGQTFFRDIWVSTVEKGVLGIVVDLRLTVDEEHLEWSLRQLGDLDELVDKKTADMEAVDEEPVDTNSADKELVDEELVDETDLLERTRRWSRPLSSSGNSQTVS